MNEQQLIISLLIIVTCNLGVLYLWFCHSYTNKQTLSEVQQSLGLVLARLSEASSRQRGMKQALLEDGKLTRQRIAQVKTRLADEERQDRKDKAVARRKGVQSWR